VGSIFDVIPAGDIVRNVVRQAEATMNDIEVYKS
jgi:hypothetical protein